jgi:hypothetical protein
MLNDAADDVAEATTSCPLTRGRRPCSTSDGALEDSFGVTAVDRVVTL